MYGDLTAANHSCGPNGTIDIQDIFIVLDGFQSIFYEPCTINNVDIAGSGGACESDGLIDIQDIFAVTDAYQGNPACCTENSAKSRLAQRTGGPTRQGISRATARLELLGHRSVVTTSKPLTEVDVYAEDVVDLSGYQIAFTGPGVVFADNSRDEYAYSGLRALHRFDSLGVRFVNLLFDEDADERLRITRQGLSYPGTFRGNAEGATLRMDSTVLLDSEGQEMDVRVSTDG